MDALVLVEMPRLADARGLIETLRGRGLTAELVSLEGRWEIEISSATEETEQVATEVSGALDAWLAEQGLPFIPMRLSERAFAVRPPSD